MSQPESLNFYFFSSEIWTETVAVKIDIWKFLVSLFFLPQESLDFQNLKSST